MSYRIFQYIKVDANHMRKVPTDYVVETRDEAQDIIDELSIDVSLGQIVYGYEEEQGTSKEGE